MTIYISGPITGCAELNRPAFAAEESRLRALGLAVFNPHSIEPPTRYLEGRALWQYYMRECVKVLPSCSVVRMLPGWTTSAGAREEKRIAEMLGIPVDFCDGAEVE